MLNTLNKIDVTDKDKARRLNAWKQYGFAEKVLYIWDYYKFYIFAIIILIGMCLFFLKDYIKEKKVDALRMIVVDAKVEQGQIEELKEQLAKRLELDLERETCFIETNLTGKGNMQGAATMLAYLGAGQVDILIADEENFNRYASAGFLLPVEMSALEESSNVEYAFYAVLHDYSKGGAVSELEFDPKNLLGEGECYGIYLTDGVFKGYVAGIVQNAANPERAEEAFCYLTDSETRNESFGLKNLKEERK